MRRHFSDPAIQAGYREAVRETQAFMLRIALSSLTPEEVGEALALAGIEVVPVTDPRPATRQTAAVRVFAVRRPIFAPFVALPGDRLVLRPGDTPPAAVVRDVPEPTAAQLRGMLRRGALEVLP